MKTDSQVYFMTFAVADNWSGEFGAFPRIGTLVVDEAHQAGVNRKNVTITAIRRLNTVAYRVVFLSATPMWNKPAGLFPILDTICPGAFGGYWPFCIRYADAKPGEHGWSADGVSHEAELAQRLGAIMLRRTWHDIQPDLPPINRVLDYIDLSDEEHDRVFNLANDLRQAASQGKSQTVAGNLERLRKLYARTKIKRAAQVVRQALSEGRNIVAWTYHEDAAKALAEELDDILESYGPITGKVSAGGREQILEEVRGSSAPRVLIATMGTIATAISLNWADLEVFVELHWTPAVMQQAEARPFDGTRPVTAIYLIADCETDRRQADALLVKMAASDTLGLRPGSGDIADVLSSAFQIDAHTTLEDVARKIVEDESY